MFTQSFFNDCDFLLLYLLVKQVLIGNDPQNKDCCRPAENRSDCFRYPTFQEFRLSKKGKGDCYKYKQYSRNYGGLDASLSTLPGLEHGGYERNIYIKDHGDLVQLLSEAS